MLGFERLEQLSGDSCFSGTRRIAASQAEGSEFIALR